MLFKFLSNSCSLENWSILAVFFFVKPGSGLVSELTRLLRGLPHCGCRYTPTTGWTVVQPRERRAG